MGSQEKIDRVTSLVDGAIQVFPLASDLNVGLVDTPALADGELVAAKRFLQYRQQLDGPAVHGRMIDRNAALSHHFFEVSQAQRVGHVPTHASQDHVER
jgi:hypothetical protein